MIMQVEFTHPWWGKRIAFYDDTEIDEKTVKYLLKAEQEDKRILVLDEDQMKIVKKLFKQISEESKNDN